MVCFWPKYRKISTKTNKSEPVQRRFHGKIGPNWPDFEEKEIQITRFL
jgi:hypothetical protein